MFSEDCDPFCVAVPDHKNEIISFYSFEGDKYSLHYNFDVGSDEVPEGNLPSWLGLAVAVVILICETLFPNWCKINDKDDPNDIMNRLSQEGFELVECYQVEG